MAIPKHAAFAAGKLAIITGAASGIGLAMAHVCALKHMMHVLLIDISDAALPSATAAIASRGGKAAGYQMDVASSIAWARLKMKVEADGFGLGTNLTLLHLNAGMSKPSAFDAESTTVFQEIVSTNLFGVTNGICSLLALMQKNSSPGSASITKAIIITGSKQGITNPPGNPAYNCSKAAVRSVAESLSHSLSASNPHISAHLLVPGWTFTGMTSGAKKEKPPGAWSPEQVVQFLDDKMASGTFYVLCPDNEVDEETDRRRIVWGMGDLVQGRPPLSRWREDGGWAHKAKEGMANLDIGLVGQ